MRPSNNPYIVGKIGTSRAKSNAKKRNKRALIDRSNPPYKLKVPLELYKGSNAIAIERSWLVVCSTEAALTYVRKAIARLMHDLDGVIVTSPADAERVEDPIGSST